jgi:hypothetical protein
MPNTPKPRYRPTIPAKLDVSDKHGRAWLGNNPGINVFLDGKPQKRVLSYDIPAGTLTKYKEENGKVVLDLRRGIAVSETLTGRVTVEWAE